MKPSKKQGIIVIQSTKNRPVMIAVRLLASIPSITCSAVEEDPNPLHPGLPVINEKIPTILSTQIENNQICVQSLKFNFLFGLKQSRYICMLGKQRLLLHRLMWDEREELEGVAWGLRS